MRIIAGKGRGRRLRVPTGREVRPTADRVREALFSSLGARVEGARVLDLFAGSGALGLEALSRGAASAVFVERSRRVLEALRRNVSEIGFDSEARILGADWAEALSRLEREELRFDLVFLDPPYARPGQRSLADRALFALAAGSLLDTGAILVAEHPAGAPPTVPEQLRAFGEKVYGSTGLTMIERTG